MTAKADDSAEAGAPEEDEVEITPKMIEAGAMALVTHDPEHYTLDEIVISIWREMSRARSAEDDGSDCPSPAPKES